MQKRVHMAVRMEQPATCGPQSPLSGAAFPSVGSLHPPAIRLERAIHSLYGLEPRGAPDDAPVAGSRLLGLAASAWRPARRRHANPTLPPASKATACTRSRSARSMPASSSPGIFASPPMARRWCGWKQRLGYAHKGIEALMAGAISGARRTLAGAPSGDSTVAYGIAFARAVEAALGIDAPPRAPLSARADGGAGTTGQSLRRYRRHLQRRILLSHACALRHFARACAARGRACFGHRLMMDCVVPGGVAADLDPDGAADIRDALARVRRRLPQLIELYDNTASLQDRTVAPASSRRIGAAIRRRRLCRACLRPHFRCAARRPAIRLTTARL